MNKKIWKKAGMLLLSMQLILPGLTGMAGSVFADSFAENESKDSETEYELDVVTGDLPAAYIELETAEVEIEDEQKDEKESGDEQTVNLAGETGREDTLKKMNSVLADTARRIKLDAVVPGASDQWRVLGLARKNSASAAYQSTFYLNMGLYTAANKGVLSTNRATEYARAILSVTATGRDARRVYGYNLFKALADYSFVRKQGLMGPTWTLIALNANPKYHIPVRDDVTEQTGEEKLISFLLNAECANGGWTLYGSYADTDATAMVLQALAPYYGAEGYDTLTAAVDRGVARLSEMQNSQTGGFTSMGKENSESCAQVIVALTALGIDPMTDSRFVKGSHDPIENLLSYSVSGGGFIHEQKGKRDAIATEQGYYALVAYDRFLNGQTALYDMSDLELIVGDSETQIDPVEPDDPEKEDPTDPGESEDPGKEDPTDPGESEDPGKEDPADPGESEDPGKEDPTDPGESKDPGKEDPTKPEETKEPEKEEKTDPTEVSPTQEPSASKQDDEEKTSDEEESEQRNAGTYAAASSLPDDDSDDTGSSAGGSSSQKKTTSSAAEAKKKSSQPKQKDAAKAAEGEEASGDTWEFSGIEYDPESDNVLLADEDEEEETARLAMPIGKAGAASMAAGAAIGGLTIAGFSFLKFKKFK